MRKQIKWFEILSVKGSLAWAVIFLGTATAFAVPAHPGLGVVRQPDGTEVRISLHGDKWCHWHEDEDGYTVMREPVSKEWVYADVDDEGESVPTTLRVGKADPSRTLKKGVRAKRQLSKAGKARAKTLQQEEPQKTSTKGTLRNLVVLVQFPDLKFRYGKSDFENLYNQTGYSTSGASGSVKDYYREVSYGQLNLESVIAGPVTVSGNYAEYGENASDSQAVKDMVAEALSLLERQGFDFSQCDVDGDGEIDGLDIIHAGYGAEFNGNSEDYIWSHKWQMRTAVTYDGVRMYKYHTEAEIHGRESSPSSNTITSIGVICHETGHFLGLPDLYDTDYSSEGAGDFCIMAGGSWNGNGKCPAHMSAWCKVNLGWVTPTVISAAGDYSLPRVEDNRKIYKIRGNFASQSEYFLVENRQGYGFDAALPGSNRGMLIWHIDDAKTSNSNESHYWVDLEEASGTQHLQLGTSSGDDADYWRSSTLSSFSASSTPNSSSYSGEALGISISSISASSSTMSFRVATDGGSDSTVSLGTALDNTSLTFTTGGSSSWAGQSSQTHDGVDAARSGTLDHGQQTWFQTTVTGQGTVSFWWYASSEANYDFLEFLVDGEVKESMSGTSNSWTSKSVSITSSGTHTLQWRYRKDGSVSSGLDAGFVDQVTWTPVQPATYTVTYKPGSYGTGSQQTATKTQDVALTLKGAIFTRSGYTQTGWSTSDGGTKSYGLSASYTANASVTLYPYWTSSTPSISLATALDNTSLTFTTGGSSSWAGQSSQTHDGVDAARSGTLDHGQQTWFQTTVTGQGTVSFWWYASSEANYDFLEFLVDGEVKESMSGTSNSWTSKSVSITSSGTHTLQWRYRKDGSVSSGLDAGFVDQVTWNASASPDLSFTTRTGWSAPVVASASSANTTNVTATSFKSTEPLYVSWSIKCANKDIGTTFYSRLLIDGVQQKQWYTSGLKAGHVAWVTGYNVGKLSVGTHTIKVVTDSTGVVGESNENNNTYTKTITVVRGNVPGNDDFSAATWLNGSYGEATGSNVDATSQSGEPLLQYKSSAKTTVWWKWTAPSSGTVRFATEGSSFDTVMGVYTGYTLSSLTVKAQDDDGGANRTSVCTFSAVAGSTYYICVAGYSSASGTVKLSWRPAQTLVVKLNANGGTLSGVAWKPVRKSAAVGSLKKPTRAGYTFAGWYTKKSGGTKVSSKTKITKAVTFYAHWKAKKYTVTLKKTGKGTVSGGGKKTYKAKITLVAKPASGYVFQGWYKDGTLVSTKAKWKTTVPLNGATYTAKFVKRSATSAAVEAKDAENDPATESAPEPLPAPAAGTYDGWSYAEDAAGEFLPARKATVVVASDGKISAKVGTLKFSGDWHDVCTGCTDAKDGTATVVLRAVRTVGTGADAQDFTDVLTLAFDADADWTVDQLTGVLATYKGDVTVEEAKGLEPVNDDAVLSARRNAFGENEEAQALAAELAARGVLKLVDGDGLAWLVKVAENGVATVLRDSDGDGTPVTATAVVAAQDLGDGKLCAVVRFPSSDRVVTIVVK